MMRIMKSRKMSFLGHVIRRNSIENLMIAGKIDGKRATGRQTHRHSVKDWSSERGNELLNATSDRNCW